MLNDDDVGFFIVDKQGVVRTAVHGPHRVYDGVKPLMMQPIPSNEEILSELVRCEAPFEGATRS